MVEKRNKVKPSVWDVWRPVVVAEMERQELTPYKIARAEPGVAMRSVYSCLYESSPIRSGASNVPKIDTLHAILKALGKSWGWLERQVRKAGAD